MEEKTLDNGFVTLSDPKGLVDIRRSDGRVYSEVLLIDPKDAKYFRPPSDDTRYQESK